MNKVIIILVLISLVFRIQGQNTMNQEVHVVKAYEPSISDAFKINFMPQVSDTIPIITKFSYRLEPTRLDVSYTPQPIPSAKVTGEPLQEFYRTYVKLGGGNYASALGEIGFNTLRNKEYTAAAFFKHQSSATNLKLDNNIKVPGAFSDNRLLLGGEKFIGKKSLYGNLDLARNVFHYYGYNYAAFADTVLKKGDVDQRIMNINTQLGFKSYFLDSSKINYDFWVNYGFFEDLNKSSQNKILANMLLSNFYKKELLTLHLKVSFFNKLSLLDTMNNGLIHLNPKVSFFGEKWRIETGINMDVDAYGDSINYHYYPKVFLQYNVIEDLLIPYFGFNGEMITNDFERTFKENQFVVPGIHVKNTNHLVSLNFGFKGRFSRLSSFNFSGSYYVTENTAYFLPDSNGIENFFNVVYDNSQIMKFTGEYAFKKSEKLNIFLTANYYHYNLDSIKQAWNKPSYDVTLSAFYNLKNKIIVGFDLRNEGERYSRVWHPQMQEFKLKSVIDASLHLEYRYSKVFSAWLDANNVLHRKNYIWAQYPTQRFNVMGGITYSF